MSAQTTYLASPPRPRVRSLSLGGTFVLLAAVTAAVAFVPYMGFMALSAVLVGSFIAYMRLRPDSQDGYLLEVIIPISVMNILYFCVGTMYLVIVPGVLEFPALRPFLLPAMALAVLGFLCFLIGYALFFRTTAPSPLGRLLPRGVLVYLVAGAIGSAGMSAGEFQHQSMVSDQGISTWLSFFQQFGSLFYFAWFLAWYMTWTGRLRLSTAVPLLAALSGMASIVIFLNFGGKTLAATLLALPAMAYYEVKRKFPVKSVVAVALVFVFVIFPLFNTFRAQNKSLDTSRRLDMTVGVARNWSSGQFLDASLFAVFDRLAIVTAVAAIVSDTGRWVDYRYGETLILAPIGLFIPRFLWPSKPNISIGKEFGATFRITPPMDRETEVAPTMVGDFYWNFSVPGAVVGMWLLGMGYRWYYQRFGAGRGFDPIRKSIYATMLPAALLVEGNVAIVVSGFVKALLILVVFLVVLRRIGWLEEIETH